MSLSYKRVRLADQLPNKLGKFLLICVFLIGNLIILRRHVVLPFPNFRELLLAVFVESVEEDLKALSEMRKYLIRFNKEQRFFSEE